MVCWRFLQIIAACREDPAQLKSTVAMLHAAFEQVTSPVLLLRAACLGCQPLCQALWLSY